MNLVEGRNVSSNKQQNLCLFVKFWNFVCDLLQVRVCSRDLRSGNFFPVVRDLITLSERWETIFRTLVERFYHQSSRKSPFSFFDSGARLQGVRGRSSFDI